MARGVVVFPAIVSIIESHYCYNYEARLIVALSHCAIMLIERELAHVVDIFKSVCSI